MDRRSLIRSLFGLPFVGTAVAALPAVAERPRVWPVSYDAFDPGPWGLRPGEELTIAGVTDPKTGALKRFKVVGVGR